MLGSKRTAVRDLVEPVVKKPQFGGKRVFRLWLALFVLMTLGNAVGGRWFTRAEPADFSNEPSFIARALLRQGEFRDPFVTWPTGSSAHSAPGYPLLYAGIVKVFGTGKAAWLAIRFLTLAAW